MILFPNAKINLGLAVTEKRFDGYHNIESVFIPLPLCDTLEIIASSDFQFKSFGLSIEGNPEQNLCVKAFQLLKNEFNIPLVKIYLYKNIPIGAGLGGGSSDAAFTLIGLNKIFCLGLTNKQLTYYATLLGSDCAFFIKNKPAFAMQRGNLLEPVSINLNEYYIKVIKPTVHIPTANAYKKIDPQKSVFSFKHIVEEKNVKDWKNYLYNDFEKQAFFDFPILQNIKDELYNEGALFAGMTGSGSAIFGIYDSQPNYFNSKYFCWIGKL